MTNPARVRLEWRTHRQGKPQPHSAILETEIARQVKLHELNEVRPELIRQLQELWLALYGEQANMVEGRPIGKVTNIQLEACIARLRALRRQYGTFVKDRVRTSQA